MIATVLTLLLMIMVVQIFAMVGTATSETRAVLELNERLRNCKITLQADLRNITARMLPPLKVEDHAGYFEYVEGPMGPVPTLAMQPIDSIRGIPDTSVGDIDDVLMFTTRNESQPFYGRTRVAVTTGTAPNQLTTWTDTTTMSQYAEVCYFVRGNTLYRRVLLIRGDLNVNGTFPPAASLSSNYNYPPPIGLQAYPATYNPPFIYDISFYDKYDISVRQEGGTYDKSLGSNPVPQLVANSLSDLTRRENRYGHQPHAYPYDTRFWGPLGLPTLRECTFYTNFLGYSGLPPTAHWPFPFYEPNPNLATMNIAPTESSTLWASQGFTPLLGVAPNTYPNGPYIYPYPSVAAVASEYQNYYQHATMVGYNGNLLPGGATPNTYPGVTVTGKLPLQYIYLTQNGVGQNGVLPSVIDCWRYPNYDYSWDQVSPFNGAIAAFSLTPDETDPINPGQYDASTRVSDDVILTNVISFDVKAWDPNAPLVYGTIPPGSPPGSTTPGNAMPTTYLPGDGANMVNISGTNYLVNGTSYLAALLALGSTTTITGYGAYVDLNYQYQIGNSYPSIFSGPGNPNSPLQFIYDTGCFAYEEDGIDQDGIYGPDQFTNGFDDNNIGGVDDITELEGPIPYPYPLKGIQIKIRVFEPDSRQIREITVVEDFLWE